MKVLVTGNSGFIGRALVGRLSTMPDIHVQLFRTSDQPRDICDRGAVHEAVRGIDVVFHLAGMLNYRGVSPLLMYKVNLEGTKTVLQEALAAEVSSIVLASSQAVYAASDGAPGPLTETSPLQAKDAYGESKLKADQFCIKHLNGPSQVTVLRIATVYGPDSLTREDVMARFLTDARAIGKVRVFGKGLRIRDLVFIEDVIEAMVRLRGIRGVYNIGGGYPYTTREIADTVCGFVGGHVEYDDSKQEDVGFFMDISKVQATIGYKPLDFRIGLARSLEHQH